MLCTMARPDENLPALYALFQFDGRSLVDSLPDIDHDLCLDLRQMNGAGAR